MAPTTLALPGFRDQLLQSGLLIPTGVDGVYGRSLEFEDTLTRVDRLVSAFSEQDQAEVVRFPPLLGRTPFAASGYLDSFPHLAGAIHCFEGTDREHRSLMQSGAQAAWQAALRPSEVVLTPAACYPVYPMLTGRLPGSGRCVDVMSYCFRHEPSDDVARMQIFRMHEQVAAGEAEALTAWRNTWCLRVIDFADRLGLDARLQVASDPFFGRGGKLLAESQRERRLKLEVVAPIASDDEPTAVISLNDHQDHFGARFGITVANGDPAHTSCVGFGLERLTLALYRRHGIDRAAWTPSVQGALDL